MAGPESGCEARGTAAGAPARPLLSSPAIRMGASVPDSIVALDEARRLFAESTDFTIGIEEEFQILDAETLGMVNRFEELKALADATPLGPNTAGELIASEIEIKTGRCETFAEAAALLRDRRRDVFALADRLGVTLCATGTHPFSPWTEQRIIDTPHYRLVEGTLRYIAWRNNTFGIHVHVGIRDADRAIAVMNALRTVIPELLAVSASSPWLEGRITHLRSTRTQIFTRMFPRCGIPDAFDGWDAYDQYVRFLLQTGSIREHTEIWWTVRPHLSFGTVEMRACDGLPDLDQSIAVCALQVALMAMFARRHDEGAPLPNPPHRELEENFWRSLRWGTSRELIDLERRAVLPVRERVRALLAEAEPEVQALGLAPFLAPLDTLLEEDNATRLIRLVEEGADMGELFAEEVRRTRDSIGSRVG
jgi:glutamate---cysteine ligase / carboxylate-amine ligase